MDDLLKGFNLSDQEKISAKTIAAFSVKEMNKIYGYCEKSVMGKVSNPVSLNKELDRDEPSFFSFDILPMYFGLRARTMIAIRDFENASFYLLSLFNVINRIKEVGPSKTEYNHILKGIEGEYLHLKKEVSSNWEYKEEGQTHELCKYFLMDDPKKIHKEFDIRFRMKYLGISRNEAVRNERTYRE